MIRKVICLLLVLSASPSMSVLASPDMLDGWQIVQISATDRLAVAKSPEGELRLVREGDRLGESIKVAGFDSERVILEQPGRWGRATLFVRVVDGRQQVERREVQPLRKRELTGKTVDIVAMPMSDVR